MTQKLGQMSKIRLVQI